MKFNTWICIFLIISFVFSEDIAEQQMLNVTNGVVVNTLCKYLPFLVLILTKYFFDNVMGKFHCGQGLSIHSFWFYNETFLTFQDWRCLRAYLWHFII